MAAEWREIFTVASAVVARQTPPVQIFVWLSVAFVLVMFIEGLRVSFLPSRFRKDVRHLEAMRAHAPAPPFVARANPQTPFVRAQRTNLVRSRKLIDTTPRRHQTFRPKIRRISSAFEVVAPEVREQPLDLDARHQTQTPSWPGGAPGLDPGARPGHP